MPALSRAVAKASLGFVIAIFVVGVGPTFLIWAIAGVHSETAIPLIGDLVLFPLLAPGLIPGS